MTDLLTTHVTESLIRLHNALDQTELAQACGVVVEGFVGSVPWQVRLVDPQKDEPEVCFHGVGESVGRVDEKEVAAPAEYVESTTIDLRFRGEVVGHLLIGSGDVPDEAARSILGGHIGASLVNLQLWTQADAESRERRLGREMLGDISALLGSFDIEYVLARALEQVLRVVGSDVGSVMFWDGSRFTTPVIMGLSEEVTRAVRLEGRPVAEVVAQAGEPICLSDPDLEGLPEHLASVRLEMLLVIPLISGGRVVGVLQAANPRFGIPGSPYLDAAEEVCRLSAVAVENALLHREAVQRERMATIGQVMAGLSHDIKNMLQAMKAGVYVLRLGVEKQNMDNVTEAYPMIRSAMDRISDFVLEVLDYSKSRVPARKPMDLNALAEEIVTAMRAAADERGVDLTLHADEAINEIPADSTGVFRCLSNLVTNAVEAVEKGAGAVEVRTEWREGTPLAAVIVRDNGPGIAKENQEKIFDALFSTKGSKGTGLGLATTKKIIEEHGGEIRLDSEQGLGTTFTILLPKEV